MFLTEWIKTLAGHIRPEREPNDKKVDAAVAMTFPASDAPASGRATGTEPPARPVDRKAPLITKEQIDAAAKAPGTPAEEAEASKTN